MMKFAMIFTALSIFAGVAQAGSAQMSCGGRIIDRVSANGFDRFSMTEDYPGHLVYSKSTDGIEFRAEAKYNPNDERDELRLQVSIGAKAAVTVKLLQKNELANVMLMNDLNALTQSGRVDPRFIDLDCVRVQ